MTIKAKVVTAPTTSLLQTAVNAFINPIAPANVLAVQYGTAVVDQNSAKPLPACYITYQE